MDQDYREAMKLSNQLCFPLYAAARNVTGLYTPCLKPLGLTYTQYIVLDNGTLSPLLKKMEQAGYIERQRSHEDERIVVISLTEAGRQLQEKAKEIPQKVAACIDLPTEKAGQLYALLYELLDNQGYENPNTRKEQKNENSL